MARKKLNLSLKRVEGRYLKIEETGGVKLSSTRAARHIRLDINHFVEFAVCARCGQRFETALAHRVTKCLICLRELQNEREAKIKCFRCGDVATMTSRYIREASCSAPECEKEYRLMLVRVRDRMSG